MRDVLIGGTCGYAVQAGNQCHAPSREFTSGPSHKPAAKIGRHRNPSPVPITKAPHRRFFLSPL